MPVAFNCVPIFPMDHCAHPPMHEQAICTPNIVPSVAPKCEKLSKHSLIFDLRTAHLYERYAFRFAAPSLNPVVK